MLTSRIGLFVPILTAYRFAFSLNPCMVDRDACVPIEDFEVNCTCILTSGEPINATDDVFMFFMGHQFPFYLFRQVMNSFYVKMPKLFREKLNLRIPAAHDFEASLDMPETIYKNLRFEENMALFLFNSSSTTAIIRMLINESVFMPKQRTSSTLRNWVANQWLQFLRCMQNLMCQRSIEASAIINVGDITGMRVYCAGRNAHKAYDTIKLLSQDQ